MTINNVM